MSVCTHIIQKPAQSVMTCKNILFAIVVWCLMLFGSAPVMAGQTQQSPAPSLFTYVSTGKASPSTITPSDSVVETRLIQINFDLLAESRSQALRFPLGGTEFEAARTDFEVRSETSFTWRGKFPDDGGDITLTVVDGLCAGIIQSPVGLYEIAPTETLNVSELRKLDELKAPTCGGAPAPDQDVHSTSDMTEQSVDALRVATMPNAALSMMDIMIVYTTKAKVAAGGTSRIVVEAQNAVDVTNTAYINSQINARLRLVHTVEVAYAESNDFTAMLEWMRANPTITALRDTHSADLVSMLVTNETLGGRGYLMGSDNLGPDFEAYAYSVVTRRYASSYYVLAHEVGHNLGCQHDVANAGSQGAYPYSYGHYYAGVYRTVMAYDNYCQCSGYAGFSNPGVTYLGRPTGIPNQRDNARTINQTAPIVAIFRGEGAPVKPLNVTSPNGGETWTVGSTYNITWAYTSEYPYSSVQIELLRGVIIDRFITFDASVGNNGVGSYTWTIPADVTSRSDYKIRVSSPFDFIYDDESNAVFSINSPSTASLTMTSPNGGESWNTGSTQTIRWNYTGNPGSTVKLDLLKGGLFQQTIAASTSVGSNGTGSFTWAIPATLLAGNDYTIKVTSTTNTGVNDTSNSPFSVVSGSATATIQVVTPNGGEAWKTRTRQAITWSYAGNPGTKVKIELYKGGAFKQVISAGATLGSNGAGAFNWLLPSTLAAGTDYKIKITSTTSTAITDLSDQNFSITR